MTREELAALLNGREYTNEITREETAKAKDAGLLVIFGYSDDGVKLRGLFNDEAGAYEGGEFYILRGQIIAEGGGGGACFFINDVEGSKRGHKIEAVFSPEMEPAATWLIKTDLPHSTFDIMEDGDLFCRGVVIDKDDLEPPQRVTEAFEYDDDFRLRFARPLNESDIKSLREHLAKWAVWK